MRLSILFILPNERTLNVINSVLTKFLWIHNNIEVTRTTNNAINTAYSASQLVE